MILVIILLTALINIALGVVSYNKNPRSVTHRLLTALTIIFALWTVSNYFSLNSVTKEDTLFWIRAVMFVTAPLGPTLYLFVKAYPYAELSVNKIVFRMLVILTLIVQALAFTPLIFSDVTITDQITPTPGPGVGLYALLLIGAPLVGFWELVKKFRRSGGLERLQLKYLIFGISETFGLLILTNFIAVVIFKYSGFVIFGPIFSLILVGFIAYAIIRHRLLEIRAVVAKSILYALLILITALIYVMGLFLTSQYIIRDNVDNQLVIIYAVLALLVAFTFVPLKEFLEKITSRIFFKGKYDQHDLVFQLTKIIASNINLEELTRKTLRKLLSTLRIYHGQFVIFQGPRKYEIIAYGKSDHLYEKGIVKTLYNLKKIIIFDEEKNNKTKQLMRDLDASIVMPLFERGEKAGVLILGEKKSGEIYSERDLGVLEIFAPAISIALQNAKSYQEIRNFNVTLKKEVNKATKELQTANLKLRELGRQKDEFIAIASHELKTPVTSIKLYTQLLHRKFQKAKDNASADAVAKMDGQINKLTDLINDLLDVSKIEEGKLRLNLEVFDLNSLVSQIVEQMQLTTKQKIVKEFESNELVNADHDRLGQVLINLLSNAIKYGYNSEKIIVRTTKEDRSVKVSVQDFGIGLTQQDQEKVFERFNRAGQEGKDGIPGLGLGLYISKEIIHRHKGKIRVESRRGKGSVFSFSLPVHQKIT